jgi:hydroxypyruvate isomerase
MKLSLCLEMLFTERPFTERLKIASQLGYRAIEFWDWRGKDLTAIIDAAAHLGLTIAAMSGNRHHALIDAEARAGLLEEMEQVFAAARRLRCHHVMMLSDVLKEDGSAAPVQLSSDEEKTENIIENLRALASRAEAAGVILLLEPLNTALNHRGCFLNSSALSCAVIQRVDSQQVKLLYDIYHMSMMGEDVLAEIERNFPWIGYFHVADRPGRHQPGTGVIDYRAVNQLLKRLRYEGFIGLEFSPLGPDEQAAQTPLEIFV